MLEQGSHRKIDWSEGCGQECGSQAELVSTERCWDETQARKMAKQVRKDMEKEGIREKENGK